jgi:hypothetical protein
MNANLKKTGTERWPTPTTFLNSFLLSVSRVIYSNTPFFRFAFIRVNPRLNVRARADYIQMTRYQINPSSRNEPLAAFRQEICSPACGRGHPRSQ